MSNIFENSVDQLVNNDQGRNLPALPDAFLRDDKGEAEAMQSLRNWNKPIQFRQAGTKLDWYVDKIPAMVNGQSTDYSGIVRRDTGEVFQMAKTYEAVQNWELYQLCKFALAEIGSEVCNLGYLGSGELVFIQACTGETHVGNSGVKKYITTLNSHDGSTALRFGNSMVNVVCQNTFFAAYKELANSVRHSANIRQRLKGMIDAFTNAEKQQVSLFDSLNRLADTPVTSAAIFKVVETMFDIKKDDIEKAPTRTKNQISELKDSIALELGRQGSTLWGLNNGVTHYTTHKANTGDNSLKSKMAGQNQKRDNDVLKALLNLVPTKVLVTV